VIWLLALAGVVLLVLAMVLRRLSAPPVAGTLVYADTDRRELSAPLVSHRSGIVGKPDYVYRVKGLAVPDEVKKHRAGRFGPRAWDVAQLLAYCVILEDNGATVTHGLLDYADRRFTIPYGPEERQSVLDRVERTRAERRAGKAERGHQDAWRCCSCGERGACGQRLM
jgi:CRISPR/Cas system-associated exonuclease Cas4 (RecB family)